MPKKNPEKQTRRFHDALKRLNDGQLTSLEQSLTGLINVMSAVKPEDRLLVISNLLDIPDRTTFFAKFRALRTAEADLMRLNGKE